MHLSGEAKKEVLETVVVTMLKGGGEKNTHGPNGSREAQGCR